MKQTLLYIVLLISASCTKHEEVKGAQSLDEIINIAKEVHTKSNIKKFLKYSDSKNSSVSKKQVFELFEQLLNVNSKKKIKSIKQIKFSDYKHGENQPDWIRKNMKLTFNIQPDYIIKINLEEQKKVSLSVIFSEFFKGINFGTSRVLNPKNHKGKDLTNKTSLSLPAS